MYSAVDQTQVDGLTVLSFGGGQDSTCLLYRIILNPGFRRRWVRGHLIVVFSNTGNEHPSTYRHLRFIRGLCKQHGVEFYMLSSGMGYHPRTWLSLLHHFRRNRTIMSLAFPRRCSDNLKIKPIYNFLDHYIARRYYGYDQSERPRGKRFIKRFASEHGKIRMILGIAMGEERRIAKADKKALRASQLDLFKPVRAIEMAWMRQGVEKVYPLVSESMDREACQRYIRSTGLPLPYPSNCMFCPYLSKVELLWMHRFLPEQFRLWVALERDKIARFDGMAKRNLGVKGEKLLEEVLAEAIAEFGHLTDQELDDHKMSHGHCVLTSF